MNEMINSKSKHEIIEDLFNVEYLEEVKSGSVNSLTKIPLDDISTIGSGLASLLPSFSSVQNVLSENASEVAGGEGLYRVVFPQSGGTLSKFKDGSGYLGSVIKDGSMSQARLIKVDEAAKAVTAVPFDPVTAAMMVALASMNQKLDEIKELQKEIINFQIHDKQAKQKGDLETLSDVINNYRYNWNNPEYKTLKLHLVQDIKRESKQNMIFYQKQIKENMKKKGFISFGKEFNSRFNKIFRDLSDYRLSVYLYSFSSFLDVMLLGNFDKNYLTAISKDLDKQSLNYREVYSICHEELEKHEKKTVEKNLLKGFSYINKVAGETISKIPLIEKGKVDEFLIESSDKIKDFGNRSALEELVQLKESKTIVFKEKINTMNTLFNDSLELVFDSQNVYLDLK